MTNIMHPMAKIDVNLRAPSLRHRDSGSTSTTVSNSKIKLVSIGLINILALVESKGSGLFLREIFLPF